MSSPVSACVCLSVCLHCSDLWKPWPRKVHFNAQLYLQNIQVVFVYHGHAVNISVTGAKIVSVYHVGGWSAFAWKVVLLTTVLSISSQYQDVELLHLLTHLRSGLRHFSLFRHNPHCSTRLCTSGVTDQLGALCQIWAWGPTPRP